VSAARIARQEWPFALVVAVIVVGLLLVSFVSRHWLRGVIVIAGGFALAAVLRLALSPQQAGLLAIRGRGFDAFCFALVGVLAVIFGELLPRA